MRWRCWPRFDSGFVFGSLLDEQKGDELSLRPAGELTTRQYYAQNTHVLCTEIKTAEGRYRVTDFAPRFLQYQRCYKPLIFSRKVEPLVGSPRVRVVCRPVGVSAYCPEALLHLPLSLGWQPRRPARGPQPR